MRNATLRLHRHTEVVEFRIVAFEQGGVSAWRMQNGRALGRNIDFVDGVASSDDAIRNAACVLTLWHSDAAHELVFEPL